MSELLTRLSTIAPVPVLLIPYSTTFSVPDLSIRQSTTAQYQYYWYAAEHNRLPLQVLLIRYSTLLPQYQSYWQDRVHFCHNSNPTGMIPSTNAPVPILLIRFSKYTSVPVPVLLTSPNDTIQSYTAPVPVLLIPYCTLLSHYQPYW